MSGAREVPCSGTAMRAADAHLCWCYLAMTLPKHGLARVSMFTGKRTRHCAASCGNAGSCRLQQYHSDDSDSSFAAASKCLQPNHLSVMPP